VILEELEVTGDCFSELSEIFRKYNICYVFIQYIFAKRAN